MRGAVDKTLILRRDGASYCLSHSGCSDPIEWYIAHGGAAGDEGGQSACGLNVGPLAVPDAPLRAIAPRPRSLTRAPARSDRDGTRRSTG